MKENYINSFIATMAAGNDNKIERLTQRLKNYVCVCARARVCLCACIGYLQSAVGDHGEHCFSY